MTSCSTSNFCFLRHWHIIFGTWVYHHETCVAYIHLDTMLTFDLKVRYIGFWHSFMFGPQLFCPLTKLYQFGTRAMYGCVTMGWCVAYIHDLCVTFTIGLEIKITFSLWICEFVSEQDHLCSLTKEFLIWQEGGSPWNEYIYNFCMTLTLRFILAYGYVCGFFYTPYNKLL